MRKLRTLENTKPTDQRAFKKSLKHVDKFTKESVEDTLNAIQTIVTAALEDAYECSLEFQHNVQYTIAEMSLESSSEGILTESEINHLLIPLALKLQRLYDDYLFSEIDHYSPIRVLNGQGNFNSMLDHKILVEWLNDFNGLVERAHHELNLI